MTGAKPRPRRGKGAALNARITLETREALLAEAARTGRSMSEVAEAWLDEARRGYATMDGLAVSETLRAMIRVARIIERDIGDPLADEEANAVLAGAFAALSNFGIRRPLSPEVLALERDWSAFAKAAANVRKAIDARLDGYGAEDAEKACDFVIALGLALAQASWADVDWGRIRRPLVEESSQGTAWLAELAAENADDVQKIKSYAEANWDLETLQEEAFKQGWRIGVGITKSAAPGADSSTEISSRRPDGR